MTNEGIEGGRARAAGNRSSVRTPEAAPAAPASDVRSSAGPPGFFRRHRLPLALGAIALCLYVGSIVYILYGRGQLA